MEVHHRKYVLWAAGEIDRLTARVAELDAERRVLAAAVAVHNQMRNKIRDWWAFGEYQNHTHSWHTREDFVQMWDKELSKATEDATQP